MKARLDVFVTSSSTDNIEISSTNAAKGNALRKLCQRLGIDKSETIAFGDSENDLDMLEFAGTGIVMENAAPELKSGRFTVTASCDSDGVAKILEGLFN